MGRDSLTSSWPSPIFLARTINLTMSPCLPNPVLYIVSGVHSSHSTIHNR